jgi:hypothetical protein
MAARTLASVYPHITFTNFENAADVVLDNGPGAFAAMVLNSPAACAVLDGFHAVCAHSAQWTGVQKYALTPDDLNRLLAALNLDKTMYVYLEGTVVDEVCGVAYMVQEAVGRTIIKVYRDEDA